MGRKASSTSSAVALVVGITGMAGISLAETLKKPQALGGPWKVYGVARRSMPEWFSSSAVDRYITLDATNVDETREKLSPISGEVTHVFWLAIQVRHTEEENVAVNSIMLSNVLDVLTKSGSSSVRHITIQTGTKHYMGPIFDPTLSKSLVPHDQPFREDLPRLPYPNFYYALEDLVASYASDSLTYSVHRSSIIVGASVRSVYNTLLTVAVYAAICRHEGLPFRFFGTQYTWDHFCDMTDADVLSQQHVWAAVTEKVKNEAFNITNGDFFTWKSMWRVLSEVFGVEFVPFEETGEFDIMDVMKDKGEVWDEIVDKYGLHKTKLEEITCFAALEGVLHFKLQHVCSMTKSREFGFNGFVDTFKSVKFWAERLRILIHEVDSLMMIYRRIHLTTIFLLK